MRTVATLLLLLAASALCAAELRPVRVWLKTWSGKAQATFKCEAGIRIMDADGKTVKEIEPNTDFKVTTEAQAITIAPKSGCLLLTADKSSAFYRGWIRLTPEKKLINEVSVEAYLMGVVPSEMPSSWPAEALKAQAVAARSFTVRRMSRTADKEFDVTDGEGSQTYRGVLAEKPTTNAAILATAGTVLFCDSDFCDAVYSADCGGFTAASDEMGFGTKTKYLPGTSDTSPDGDFCLASKNHDWKVEVTAPQLVVALKKLKKDVGAVKSVTVAKLGPSGRAQTVRFEGSVGKTDITGSALRSAMGLDLLKSTLFSVVQTDKGWRFAGKGWGHGVGLCQYGAAGRAKAGQTYDQILAAYYPGATLEKTPYDARVTVSP